MSEPKKLSSTFRMPAELLEQNRVWKVMGDALRRDIAEAMSPDPAVREARAERLRKANEARKARVIDQYAKALARHSEAKEVASPRLVDVMEIHRPEEGYSGAICAECLEGGWEPESVEWPCQTWLAAAGEDG